MVDLNIDGTWAQAIGPVGDLEWTERWPGGMWEASWRMHLPVNADHPVLRRGARVKLVEHGAVIGQLTLNEPDRAEWAFTASGLAREGEGFMCLDGAGNASATPDTVIDAAIARGLPWTRPASIGAAVLANAEGLRPDRSLATLLDMWVEETSQRWAVNEHGEIYRASDPTTAAWHLTPGNGQLGLADDEYASHLVGRYQSAAGVYSSVSVGDTAASDRWGRKEYGVDLTGLGVITGARATAILQGMLAKGRARLGWTNGVEVTPGQLRTAGGGRAHLRSVRAGHMVRLHGILDAQLETRMSLSFVIGEANHRADGTLAITPVGLVARDLASVLSLTPKTGPRYGG